MRIVFVDGVCFFAVSDVSVESQIARRAMAFVKGSVFTIGNAPRQDAVCGWALSDALEAQSAMLKDRGAKLYAMAEHWYKEAEALKAQLDVSRTQNAELQTQPEASRAQLEALQAQNAALQAQLEASRAGPVQRREDDDTLVARLQTLMQAAVGNVQQAADLRVQLAEKEDAIRSAHAARDRMKESLNMFRSARDRLHERCKKSTKCLRVATTLVLGLCSGNAGELPAQQERARAFLETVNRNRYLRMPEREHTGAEQLARALDDGCAILVDTEDDDDDADCRP